MQFHKSYLQNNFSEYEIQWKMYSVFRKSTWICPVGYGLVYEWYGCGKNTKLHFHYITDTAMLLDSITAHRYAHVLL